MEPLFSNIEIIHQPKYKIMDQGKKYECDIEIIAFFDLNDRPIKETIKILSKREIK